MSYRLVARLLICGLAVAAMAQSSAKAKIPESCEIGANPGQGITPPRVTSSPGPYYPDAGSEDHRAKIVKLSVIVGSNGRPCNPQVDQSPGPEFDRAALSAIRDWRWRPATKDGVAVAVRIFVEMTFQRTR